MNSLVSLGLVGAGGFGLYHQKAIGSLQTKASLHAAADRLLAPQHPLTRELASQGIRTYTDYRQLLDSEPGLQAVAIAAPISMHLEIAKEVIQRGLYVYLEKPPVPLLEQLDELIRLDVHQRVHVGFQLTYSGWFRQIQSWIRGGRFGKIHRIRIAACWPRPDSYYQRAAWVGRMIHGGQPVFDGPATNALCHLIQAIFSLAATADDELSALTEIQGELYRARPIESYDTACFRGVLASGLQFAGALTHSTELPLPYQVEIAGSGGWARVTGDGRRLESPWEEFSYSERAEQQLLVRSYHAFLQHIADPARHPLISLAQTRNCFLATNGLLVSAQKIHSLPEYCVRRYADARNDPACDVPGLFDAVKDTFATGRLFSEQDLPWARASRPVALASLTPKLILDTLRQSALASDSRPLEIPTGCES